MRKGCRRAVLCLLLVGVIFHASATPILASNIGTDQLLDTFQPDIDVQVKPQLLPQFTPKYIPIVRNPDGSVVGSPFENIPDSQLTTAQVAAKYGVSVADSDILKAKSADTPWWVTASRWGKSVAKNVVNGVQSIGSTIQTGGKNLSNFFKSTSKSVSQAIGRLTHKVAISISSRWNALTHSASNAWLDFKSMYVKAVEESTFTNFIVNIWRAFQNALQHNPTDYANKQGDLKASDYQAEKNGVNLLGKPDFGNKSTSLSKDFIYSRDKQVREIQLLVAQSLTKDFDQVSLLSTNKQKIDEIIGVQIYDRKVAIIDVKLSNEQLYELNQWISAYTKKNVNALRDPKNESQRLTLNSLYITTLRAEKYRNTINDLDVYAEGADFVAQYYGNNASERADFQKDFEIVFARRQGPSCLFSGGGCFNDNESKAYFVQADGGKGFSRLIDDSKEGVDGNLAYHMTGLGINFGFAGDNSCSFIATSETFLFFPLKPAFPFYDCLSPEEWSVFHETFQLNSERIVNEGGSSYQDLVASLLASKLGEDLRNGKIKVAEFGNEIKKRLGEHAQYDLCKDILPMVPKNERYWSDITCQDLKDNIKN